MIIGQPFSNDLFRMVLEQKNSLDDRNLRAALADREAQSADRDRFIRAQLASEEMGQRNRQLDADMEDRALRNALTGQEMGLREQEMGLRNALTGQEMGLREQEMGLRSREMDFRMEDANLSREFTGEQQELARSHDAAMAEAQGRRQMENTSAEGTLRERLLEREIAAADARQRAELSSPENMAQKAYYESGVKQREAAARLSDARAESTLAMIPLMAKKVDGILAGNQARLMASAETQAYRERLLAFRGQVLAAETAKNEFEKINKLRQAMLNLNELVSDPLKVFSDLSLRELAAMRENLTKLLDGTEQDAGSDDPGSIMDLIGSSPR